MTVWSWLMCLHCQPAASCSRDRDQLNQFWYDPVWDCAVGSHYFLNISFMLRPKLREKKTHAVRHCLRPAERSGLCSGVDVASVSWEVPAATLSLSKTWILLGEDVNEQAVARNQRLAWGSYQGVWSGARTSQTETIVFRALYCQFTCWTFFKHIITVL